MLLAIALLSLLVACGQVGASAPPVGSAISPPTALSGEDGDTDPSEDANDVGSYLGDWYQVDHCIRYTEGTAVSLNTGPDGTVKLGLRVLTNYYGSNDPVENSTYPCSPGSLQIFILRRMPEIPLYVGEDLVVYEVHMTTDPKTDTPKFLAGLVMYYSEDGVYYDMAHKKIEMPPSQYPSYDVFNY